MFHHNFPQPEVRSSNFLFCPANNPKLKDIKKKKKNKKIKKISKSSHLKIWDFCLISVFSNGWVMVKSPNFFRTSCLCVFLTILLFPFIPVWYENQAADFWNLLELCDPWKQTIYFANCMSMQVKCRLIRKICTAFSLAINVFFQLINN